MYYVHVLLEKFSHLVAFLEKLDALRLTFVESRVESGEFALGGFLGRKKRFIERSSHLRLMDQKIKWAARFFTFASARTCRAFRSLIDSKSRALRSESCLALSGPALSLSLCLSFSLS